MNLPENNRIQKLLTIEEIAAEINGEEYSAELMLQHLIVHWNRRNEWRPIESALKDGTRILVTGLDRGTGPTRHTLIARWEQPEGFGGHFTDYTSGSRMLDFLTHWHPLPGPPKP